MLQTALDHQASKVGVAGSNPEAGENELEMVSIDLHGRFVIRRTF